MTTAPINDLSDRIRVALPSAQIREVPMFGALCFIVDGAMAVAANKDGSLLVRVAPDSDAALLAEPHVSRAEMGAGRSMGTGWIRVDPAGLTDDRALRHWISTALRRRLAE